VDCCSLEGRTLKDKVVVKHLHEFVLIKLEPLKNKRDKAIALQYGVKKYPALLLLDWTGKKKLGVMGDIPPGKVAAGLEEALERIRGKGSEKPPAKQ
jgi:hypothetical protein